MSVARLHDGSLIEITTTGDGPAVLLPVGTAVAEGPLAEQMLAWGADPALGHNLATGLAAAGFRVVTADYEGHLSAHPKPDTLDARAVASDLLAIADAAAADRFAYYGYSWLALSGLQLALRTDRLTALAMGGFPPLGAPYAPMLTVTLATHRMAVANHRTPPPETPAPEPGDWDSAPVTLTPEQAKQYLTLYESLTGFDERAALAGLTVPGLAFAGEKDNIQYGPKWDDAYVALGEPLIAHRDELTARGWTVTVVPGADHIAAMLAATVLPILIPWLSDSVNRQLSQ
jgi:pimeloyl-ACP methyl ester carboxylesterase